MHGEFIEQISFKIVYHRGWKFKMAAILAYALTKIPQHVSKTKFDSEIK